VNIRRVSGDFYAIEPQLCRKKYDLESADFAPLELGSKVDFNFKLAVEDQRDSIGTR